MPIPDMITTSLDTDPSHDASGFAERVWRDHHPLIGRGEMLNLTSMWIGNERPANKKPAQWLRLPTTRRFRQILRQTLAGTTAARETVDPPDDRADPHEGAVGFSHSTPPSDGLVRTFSHHGHENGAWAHWQLALTYAHYLSPHFYIWCNDRVHGALVHFGSPPFGPARPMAARFEAHFTRLHQRLDLLGQYATDNLLLTAAIQSLPGRRLEFTERSRRILRAVVAGEAFEGICPCCGRTPVLSPAGQSLDGAQYDHFYSASLNRPEHGWLICGLCHSDLTRGGAVLRIGRIPAFHVFQGHVLDLLMDQKSSSPAPV